MAAAVVLSAAVHAALLLGRASTGSAASRSAPPAPVLLTRSVVLATPVAGETPVPSAAATVPVPVPAIEPSRPAPEPPPIERAAIATVLPSPVPRPPDLLASTVLPSPPPQLALAPVAPPLPSPSSMTYLSSGGLDPPPRPLDDIDPVVPPEAGPRGGVVVLRLFINERGGVDKAEVLSSAPPGLFDASALEAFGNARFSPGYFAGVPVKSQVTFEVKIRGLGSGSTASGRTY
jgi:TonB family protein